MINSHIYVSMNLTDNISLSSADLWDSSLAALLLSLVVWKETNTEPYICNTVCLYNTTLWICF